ncbi:hypothetical protein B0O99DRAFT_654201 [Bisporella sp. PMI_857]|nr:hypothetical protein B0O99DRAFT_654201 [Bisporella sp. PMI_857]
MKKVRGKKECVSGLLDVLCFNRYYGWYESCGDMQIAEKELEKNFLGWQREHNRWPNSVAVAVTLWSEESQALWLDMYHRAWSFSDFQTSQHVFRFDGNKKGVFTRDSRPKAAAQVLRP